MGYSTSFQGAIRILPRVEPELAVKLNLFLSLRHSKLLEMPEFNDIMTPIADWKYQGLVPRVPDVEEARKYTDIFCHYDIRTAPHQIVTGWTFGTLEDSLAAQYPLEYSREIEYFSLYSRIWLVNDLENDRSFLEWTGAEKAQATDLWLNYAVRLLAFLGYRADGVINAQGEDDEDRWHVQVTDGNHVERYPDHAEPTWAKESERARIESDERSTTRLFTMER